MEGFTSHQWFSLNVSKQLSIELAPFTALINRGARDGVTPSELRLAIAASMNCGLFPVFDCPVESNRATSAATYSWAILRKWQ